MDSFTFALKKVCIKRVFFKTQKLSKYILWCSKVTLYNKILHEQNNVLVYVMYSKTFNGFPLAIG